MDHVEANELMDIYSSQLTKRQIELMKLYYEEDLSLSEIAQELSISRAAVSQSLKKAELVLQSLEGNLHVLETRRVLAKAVKMDTKEEIISEISQLI